MLARCTSFRSGAHFFVLFRFATYTTHLSKGERIVSEREAAEREMERGQEGRSSVSGSQQQRIKARCQGCGGVRDWEVSLLLAKS